MNNDELELYGELEEQDEYEPEFEDTERYNFSIGNIEDNRFLPTGEDFMDALGF